jgi:hypothetical protein
VTADGLLPELELSLEPELSAELEELEPVDESSDELVGSADEVVVLSDELVAFPDDVVVPPEPFDVDVVVGVPLDDAVAPIEPSNAMAPKASAKIASDTAVTFLRMRAMRAARARSFSRARCFGEGVCWVGEGVCSVMPPP